MPLPELRSIAGRVLSTFAMLLVQEGIVPRVLVQVLSELPDSFLRMLLLKSRG